MRLKLTVIRGHIPHFHYSKRWKKLIKDVPGFDLHYPYKYEQIIKFNPFKPS